MEKYQELDPLTVKVKSGFERVRQDIGKIEKLAESIKKYGQIHPILITRDYELIAGGRRLAACLMLKCNVSATFQDEVTPFLMRSLELEENLQRKDFTEYEKLESLNALHALKVEEYGRWGDSNDKGAWSSKDTAKLLGVSEAIVSRDLTTYSDIHTLGLKDMKKAKTKTELRKKVDTAKKIINAVVNMPKPTEGESPYNLLQGDSLFHMASLGTDSVNILMTDPPYGIDIDKVASSARGIGNTVAGHTFADDWANAEGLYKTLAVESFRFCTKDAHAFVFCAPEFVNRLQQLFRDAGWNVYPRPIIWIKQASGQSNQPTKWPASCYEMVIYARKDQAFLVKEAFLDYLQVSPTLPSTKVHSTQKPVELLETLLSYVCHKGQVMYDPFGGSFSSVVAATRLGLRSISIEKSPVAFATGSTFVHENVGD